MAEHGDGPRYEGLTKYVARKEGFALWLPSAWHRLRMRRGHTGVIFLPDRNDPATCFSAEKSRLPLTVNKADLVTLREGFRLGLATLPESDVESLEDVVDQGIMALDARLTFREDGERRKRWTRVIYAANAQLILIAQGRTADMFEYWLPMFYNTMMTLEL